ncbi:MAG TPA: hypothetical protein VGC65_00295 [Bacteroidia bacterium]|jgi:hypothetical protein
MARTIYKNVGITIALDTGVGALAWLMFENAPVQFKIESIELRIGLDKKVDAVYTLCKGELDPILRSANEIFKSKQALLKSL